MTGLILDNSFENRFWLQIFGDQMRFLLIGLSPEETQEVDVLRRKIPEMDALLERMHQKPAAQEIHTVNREAFEAVQDYRKYVLHILTRQLTGKINIVALPSFTNHIVNDTEAYLRILNAYIKGKEPEFNPANLDLEWLIDAYAYSFTIADNLSIVHIEIRQKANDFAKEFLNLYIRAYETYGFLRTGLNTFPALIRLNKDVVDYMRTFAEFVLDLYNQTSKKKVVGNLSPLYMDYMYRIICYYITHLSKASGLPAPICDPTAPRREG